MIHIIYNSVFHEKQEQILTKNGLEKIYVWLIIMGIGDYNKGRKKKKKYLTKPLCRRLLSVSEFGGKDK